MIEGAPRKRSGAKEFTAVPYLQGYITPYEMQLHARTDVSNSTVGMMYRFEKPFGGPHEPERQSSFIEGKSGDYVCEFVHSAFVYRIDDTVFTELDCRVAAGSGSYARTIWTEKIGRSVVAPLFSINLLVGGHAIGPMTTHPSYRNADAAMFHVRLEFEKLKRGSHVAAKRVRIPLKSDVNIDSIHAVQLIAPSPSWMLGRR